MNDCSSEISIKNTPNSSRIFQSSPKIDKNELKNYNRNICGTKVLDYLDNMVLVKKHSNLTQKKTKKEIIQKNSPSVDQKTNKNQLKRDNSGTSIFDNKPIIIKNKYSNNKSNEDLLMDKEKEIQKLKKNNKEMKELITRLNYTLDNTNLIIPNLLKQNCNQEEISEYHKIEDKLNQIIQNELELKSKVSNLEKEILNYKDRNSLLQNQINELNNNIGKTRILNNEDNKEISKEKDEIIQNLNLKIKEIEQKFESENNENEKKNKSLTQENKRYLRRK